MANRSIKSKNLSFFEKYLTVFVFACIILGILLGRSVPEMALTLDSYTVFNVSIPIAIALFFMVYPIMVKIDFGQVLKAAKTPRPVGLTLFLNWVVAPLSTFLIAWFFLGYLFVGFLPGTEIIATGQQIELWRSYLAGVIILGIAPCTAMVLMWNYLARGNDGLTLIMIAVNSLVMVVVYAPLASFLSGISQVPLPWETIAFSVAIYVFFPLVSGYYTRRWIIKNRGWEWFEKKFLRFIQPVSIIALLATLILLFTFKGEVIVDNPLTIFWIAVPIFVNAIFVYALSYFFLARKLKLSYEDAAPASMIGASNHFEVAIATTILIFGLGSGAALATVVGVLIEVPLMLMLVAISKKYCGLYAECHLGEEQCPVNKETALTCKEEEESISCNIDKSD
ncbi:ACR3 family arsenite efflux transporter [Methanobacterium alkalithermotolerans]|uniref:ACR3 family arsenite efflux transporter n=1 Tax=Methanobacterium alkalithermotolerans TaxID=2731220 RepID=A0A8T8K6P7_9EURY|nr:ACR3 family arsenite efflux transporter [Methanobacterium alkalithermotolerans]QUH22700.1 ACR3 family arsenite efflux transporter [Methanobacterium alkalithermotolerans]RJS48579.1 MAG: arsenical-resistance protein [Methanobacterium sp.]